MRREVERPFTTVSSRKRAIEVHVGYDHLDRLGDKSPRYPNCANEKPWMDPDRRCGSLVKGHGEGEAGDYTGVTRAGRVNITSNNSNCPFCGWRTHDYLQEYICFARCLGIRWGWASGSVVYFSKLRVGDHDSTSNNNIYFREIYDKVGKVFVRRVSSFRTSSN